MSIPVLIQTYDEVRRLAIAGSVVAPGDFRLKKLVPSLEQAGQKAPVFAKVGEAVTRLVDSTDKTSATALLEVATLINAILYTQGETGLEGEMTPIATIDLGPLKTQASARVLKPLQEALTSTGAGRLEIIRDAYERGAFHDLRLISPALAALDDDYGEIGDLIANKILPLYGPAIILELQSKFDPKGKTGHVRRLLLLHKLDPEGTRPLIQRALDEGTKDVRVAAIGCLGDSPEDRPFLLEQAKAKAKDVRSAALTALGRCNADQATKVLCAVISSSDLELAGEPLRKSRNPVVTAALFDAVEQQFEMILAGKEKDAKKLGAQNQRMQLLLDALRGRDDARTEKLLLEMFDQREALTTVKGEPGGKDLVEHLVRIMVIGSPRVQAALVEAHATLTADSLDDAFLAASRSRSPGEVFALFSTYLTAKVDEKKKARDPAFVKREVIVNMLQTGQWRGYFTATEDEENTFMKRLDPQWLDLAVTLGRAELVEALAMPGHAGANKLLGEFLRDRLRKSGVDYGVFNTLDAMIRIAHPGATDAAVEVIQKLAKEKSHYSYYWVGHMIRRLPRDEAVPKLEALLPTLPENLVDRLLDDVTELKQETAKPEASPR